MSLTLFVHSQIQEEALQSYNLTLLDFVAGPNIELFLFDQEHMEQAKRDLKSMISKEKIESTREPDNFSDSSDESNLFVNTAEDQESSIFIGRNEFLFEFKDGGVLKFKAPSSGDCMRWLLGITKLWLYSLKDEVPEWVYAK